MSRLYLSVGLFGSGKSTWAKQMIKTNPNLKIVGGDEMRFMLNGGEYCYEPTLEIAVRDMLFDAAHALLRQGFDVILDESYCSLSREMRTAV